MQRFIPLISVIGLLFVVGMVSGQTPDAVPEALESVAVPSATLPGPSPLAGLNPALLQRMRTDLSFELRQIRQMLAQIDPGDTQLAETLKGQQGELLTQLKEINEQLKSQGVPGVPEAVPPEAVDTEASATPAVEPSPAPGDLTAEELASGTGILIRRIPMRVPPRSLVGGDTVPGGATVGPLDIPSSFPDTMNPDPGRTVWDAPPSKEIVALRETVAALQKEVESMRADIKSLETQIRLLNQNILLQSQGKANNP